MGESLRIALLWGGSAVIIVIADARGTFTRIARNLFMLQNNNEKLILFETV